MSNYKSKHTGAQVDEAVSKVLNGEVGGGGATPDWNAQEGEVGYIENKPFNLPRHNMFKELTFIDSDIDGYRFVSNEFIYEFAFLNFENAGVKYSLYLQRNDEIIFNVYSYDHGYEVPIKIGLLNDRIYLSSDEITFSEIESMSFNYLDDESFGWNSHSKFTVSTIPDYYISNRILKTTPQSLSDTDKNQALANLGIQEKIDEMVNNIPIEYGTSIDETTGLPQNSMVLKGTNKGTATGNYSVSLGWQTKAIGPYTLAVGQETEALGYYSNAEGYQTIAKGGGSHAEGANTKAYGSNSHAEGQNTEAGALDKNGETDKSKGNGAHAEGQNTKSIGDGAHAEGCETEANGKYSHAEGWKTHAIGNQSHSEGAHSKANGQYSHAEGYNTISEGQASHTSGYETEANGKGEFATGIWNKSESDTQFSVGIGESSTLRKNAFEIKNNGEVYVLGIGGHDGQNAGVSLSLQEIIASIFGYDIYVLIGQSNMAGRAQMIDGDESVFSDKVFLLNDEGNIVPATNPINQFSSIRKTTEYMGINPGFGFSKKVSLYTGRNILLVCEGRGGSKIEQWQKGSSQKYFETTMNRIRQAQKFGTVKGILWHQGEADVSITDTYMESLKTLVNSFRTELNSNVPFIVGELGRWRSYVAKFNTMLQSIDSNIPNATWVSSEGCQPIVTEDSNGAPDLTDPHFDRDSQILLGERYADKILSMVYNRSL